MKNSKDDIERINHKAGILIDRAARYDDMYYEATEDPYAEAKSRITNSLSEICQNFGKLLRKITEGIRDVNLNTDEIFESIRYIDASEKYLENPATNKEPVPLSFIIKRFIKTPVLTAAAAGPDQAKDGGNAGFLPADHHAPADQIAEDRAAPGFGIGWSGGAHPAHAAAPGRGGIAGDVNRDNDLGIDPAAYLALLQEHAQSEAARRARAEERNREEEAEFAQALEQIAALEQQARDEARAAHAPVVRAVDDRAWGGAAGGGGMIRGAAAPAAAGDADDLALAAALAASLADVPARAKNAELQKKFNNSVSAKISKIDSARKAVAIEESEIPSLKVWWKQILVQIQKYQTELKQHIVDVPNDLLESKFMHDCTHLDGTDQDAYIDAMLGLNEASFDALIHP